MIIIDLSRPGEEKISFLKKINFKNSVVYCFNNKKNTYQKKYGEIKIHTIDNIDKNLHISMVKSMHEQFYNWANETKVENENIFNFLKYKDIPSTYWLLDNWQLFISIFKYYTKTYQIRKVIDNNIAKKMVIICSSDYEGFIYQNYKNNENIIIINISKKIRNSIKYFFKSVANIFYGLSIFIGLPIFSLFRKIIFNLVKNRKIFNKNKPYAIFSPAFHYHSENKDISYDKIMASWQQFLEKNGLDYWYSDFIDFSGHNLKELIIKAKNEKNYLPLEYFFSLKVLNRYIRGSIYNFTKIKKVLSNLKKIEFLNSNVPPNIKIEILKCKYTLPFIISHYEGLFIKFLKFSDISTIIMCSEAGIIGRIFNPIAQKYGIKLIGIQHGALGEASFPYFHIEKHINKKDYTNSNRLPEIFTLPNKTVVWSEKFKSELIFRGQYPNKSITVVGKMGNAKNQKYSLDKMKKLRILNNIPVGKNIILLAIRTGGKGLNKEFDIKCLKMVFSLLKESNSFFILSKLHPLDKFELFNKVKKNLGISRNKLSITKKINIKTAILISDIVISVRSTTIVEAMEYNKPIIIINPDNKSNDAIQWSKTGAAFYATKQNEIKPILKNIINNPLSDEMIKAQDNCLRDIFGENKINKSKIMEDLLLK